MPAENVKHLHSPVDTEPADRPKLLAAPYIDGTNCDSAFHASLYGRAADASGGGQMNAMTENAMAEPAILDNFEHPASSVLSQAPGQRPDGRNPFAGLRWQSS
jgi:hypothetical protein